VLSSYVTTALNAGDTITVTTPSGASVLANVGQWSGIAATGRVDVAGTATGTSTAPTRTVTTVGADVAVVGAEGNATAMTSATPTGWTALTTATTSGCANLTEESRAAYVVGMPSGSAVTYSPTLSGSQAWAVAVVGYRAG
jgi:hypothetical protein